MCKLCCACCTVIVIVVLPGFRFLQDKSPLVEELEEALLELYEGRAAALERRRAAGDVEERPPAEAAVAAAMAVLSRGGAGAAAAAAAEAAAAAAEEKLLGLDLPIELDEFGRDANAEKKAELAQHAKQRRAHLEALERQFEAQAAGGGAAAVEPRFGEDTSEESEGEVSHFRTRQGEVQDAADAGGLQRNVQQHGGSCGAFLPSTIASLFALRDCACQTHSLSPFPGRPVPPIWCVPLGWLCLQSSGMPMTSLAACQQ
jgi:hypothetical protein